MAEIILHHYNGVSEDCVIICKPFTDIDMLILIVIDLSKIGKIRN